MKEDEIAPNQYLIFELDDKYAVELQSVHEIVELQAITAVPEAPEYIPGVMNLRGSIIPLLDIRTRFKKEAASGKVRKSVIIVDIEEMKLGIIVDTVDDLAVIEHEKISPPPQVGSNYSHVFIKSIGFLNDEMILIVDSDKLVNLNELDIFPTEEK